ncbi:MULTISPECIES: RluA family pseudouridine synthase [Allobacillus]|uniref:RNA pseudouridylate synthase n=1 Tax=Allobacillus halotolerans TaxID=570278 RepID=A0ABS6GNV8_9BACI|nr:MULTISPECIES: RluA family pseudouridine synthase [Allobacillus]MBU6080777.1 RluA family pseudouridine synthase [Allobacillus halotolerans]TSJ65776.1 RluA family pseudouridine synthase [Allobacillus sp. SKP2-8]
MNIPILYEDNHLLIVEKPVNIPVQEDQSKDKDLLTLLKEDIKVRHKKPGNVFLALVHRLDRPVGGAMVFAKTSKAASRLSDQLRRKAIERTYLAVVHGVPSKSKDQLEDYLVKDHRKNIVRTAKPKEKEAKKAVLDYEVASEKKGFSLLSVKLQTGRPHQIRVQLSSRGFPLYGDQKYGQRVNKPGQQIALWSNKLVLEHPTTKEEMEFTSTPPYEYPWKLWQ